MNKSLVPEWPTFTDVYSFTVPYTCTLSLNKCVVLHLDNRPRLQVGFFQKKTVRRDVRKLQSIDCLKK